MSEAKPENQQHQDVLTILGHDGKMLCENMVQATEDFNPKYMIREGGYGIVYKSVMPTRRVVAVKKFHSSQTGMLTDLKDFESEICVLTNIRHRNMMKLHGFRSHPKNFLLVYEFTGKGSLRMNLTSEEEAKKLDCIKRLNIVKRDGQSFILSASRLLSSDHSSRYLQQQCAFGSGI